MSTGGEFDVLIVGGGLAGLSAGLFTARQGLDTVIVNSGESMLRMNSHLENFPGFPAGVNPRLLLDMLRDQAREAGCEFQEASVDDVDGHPDGGFVASAASTDKFEYRTSYLIAATAGDANYLEHFDVTVVDEKHGSYVEAQEGGRTTVDGLYVAGGLANKPNQAIISAGHGAEVALAVLEDSDTEFAHDWTVPEGFFTQRGHDIPPGSEEIAEQQRKDREKRSLERMQDYFQTLHPDDPTLPPGVE